ncbi:hypothetical protein A5653_17915 [Mycobacterium colombiense]|uniref:Uncharacterized protein n=1 Tax=Mycobacterium colombiense TaxID=339268 RepID=A0A853M792_9MYCO|nr:hypothetical protein [Mycobacterium colombiense]OBJ14214.1 hypothetical protein A9W93_00270 [Mycobacterium colombiense]OBJ14524.1 hypothetical protein A5623_20930 [Mycobacterium colombiense]OBJ64495.1 hypothetical protein A5628_02165 [Mycobacterium colombiense]OBK67029.1 hypothetical protein A5653_17915 [Mycobacterium colombiense]
MADEELDSLYEVPPKEFTAQRARLAADAKQRGDTEAAKRISAANKPTTAAWIVNRLALRNADTRQRLADLGERLRAAHAAMDGGRIRELSAEQHKLIDELTRKALRAADLTQPSATVREDLTSTLQAAIADPQISARLGRLARPEQWSGFGAFGDAVPESVDTPSEPAKPQSTPARKRPAKRSADDKAQERRREKLSAAVATAERAKAEADDLVEERQAQRDAAQQQRDDAARALRAAERELSAAEKDYDKAREAARTAADAVKEAKARLKRA